MEDRRSFNVNKNAFISGFFNSTSSLLIITWLEIKKNIQSEQGTGTLI